MADLRIPDINTVMLSGRLTRDPELAYTANNRAYCRVSICNNRKYKTKEGEKKEEQTFLEGTVWDKFAEYVATFRKGMPVIAEGRLRQSEWTDRESGQKRSKIEMSINRLQPLEWAETMSEALRQDIHAGQSEAKRTTQDQSAEPPGIDEDCPF